MEVYPVLLTKGEEFILATIPDFNITTQGSDIGEAINMARDAIGMMGITMEDQVGTIKKSSCYESIKRISKEGEIITLVDIDFKEYRRLEELRTVRRNVSLPNWLNNEVEKYKLNVSGLLQEAIIEKLGLKDKMKDLT